MRPSQRQFETRISTNASTGHSIWLWTDALCPCRAPDMTFGLTSSPSRSASFSSSSRCHCVFEGYLFLQLALLFFYFYLFCFFFPLVFSFFVAWNYYLWVRIVVAVLKVIWIPARPKSDRLGSHRTHSSQLSSAIFCDGRERVPFVRFYFQLENEISQ